MIAEETQRNGNMETPKLEGTVDRLMEQGREWVEKGNKRHVVLRDANGKQLVSVSLTVAAIIGLASVVIFPLWGVALLVLLAIGARFKIEVVRELTDDDSVIKPKNEA